MTTTDGVFPADAASGRLYGTATRFLLALHVPFIVSGPLLLYVNDPPMLRGWRLAVAIVLGAVIGAIQLRHTLAAARGRRPAAWELTYPLLVILVYVPLTLWEYYSWSVEQWFVVASAWLLLPKRVSIAITGCVLLGFEVYLVNHFTGLTTYTTIWYMVYGGAVQVVGGAALYWACRTALVVRELDAAREELAASAVGRERLRLSRDLHDVLSQSLSAISLKADLAERLVETEPAEARHQIDDLTAIARRALRQARAVTHGERVSSFQSELEGGCALLDAAGVAIDITIDTSPVDPEAEQVLTWAVREAITNVILHSEATRCSITRRSGSGSVELTVSNDNASARVRESGSGLAGLADRVRGVDGKMSTGLTADGSFVLSMVVPARHIASRAPAEA
jgi:two-component system, NarL family, sensor histidine kinase DesK